MKYNMGRAVVASLFIIILFRSITFTYAEEIRFQVQSTDLLIYRDGLVHITQTIVLNETIPTVILPLFASSIDNLIILDENRTILDYKIDGINLAVFTLGTPKVLLQYDTQYLTRKDFDVWTLMVDTPYNITVILPEESTIIYLSDIPTSIDSDGNKIALSLFANQWEINYIFPLEPPAEFQISDLQVKPFNVLSGEEVSVSVKITNVGGQSGFYELALKINQTVEDTKIVSLETGASTIAEFKVTRQTPGTYNVNLAGLVSEFIVKQAPSNGEPSNGTPSNGEPINEGSSNLTPSSLIHGERLIAIVVALVTVLVAILVLVRRRGYNVEKIFKLHPQLNTEEKDVIQFVAENGGKGIRVSDTRKVSRLTTNKSLEVGQTTGNTGSNQSKKDWF